MWLPRPFVATPPLPVFLLLLLITAVGAEAQPFNFTFIDNDLAFDYGGLGYADVNQDGHFDLVVGGNIETGNSFAPTAYVAQSLEEGVRFERPFQDFDRTNLTTAFWHNTVAWNDYDGDGDLDFLMAGTTRPEIPFDAATRLYRNNGAGQFQEVQPGIAGMYGGTVAWGDYDNDGDADVLMTGTLADESFQTNLYANNGNGTFTAVDTALPDVSYGAVAWGDYDNDGDLDLVLTGAEPSGRFLSRIYRNDGTNGFVDIQAGLQGLAFGSVDWGDYDNDGDLDLLISGGVLSRDLFDGVVRVYRNDQNRFNAVDAGLTGVVDGKALWGDYDSDGDLDVLVAGSKTITADPIGQVYRNDGGTFVHNINLVGLYGASAAWGDDDDDGDLDIVLAGLDSDSRLNTTMYRNEERVPNAAPAPPADLQATVQSGNITLSWAATTDDFTPAAGLTYNMRVGTSPGAVDVVAPLADGEGTRFLSARGNVDHNTRWILRGLPAGTYYWSVQAIDQSFKGSAFSEEGTFTSTGPNAEQSTATDDEQGLPTQYAIHAAYPNPFQAATTIGYDLPEPTHVVLTIYNLLGAEVRTLVDQMQVAGRQQVRWDGRGMHGNALGAGVYFVRMQAGGAIWSQKVVLIK